MKFTALVEVMPLKLLLDPQGKAVETVLKNAGYPNIANVRIGKHIVFEIEAATKEEAKQRVEAICSQILANPTMESFQYQLVEQ